MAPNLNRCLQQQEKLTRLVDGLSEQLDRVRISESNVAGMDFPKPMALRTHHGKQIPSSQIKVREDLDIGTFSGSDPVPHDELTYEQWRSDVVAYQGQFPEYALLPAVFKSIQGKAKSVLWNLGPDFTIDQAVFALTRECLM